MADCPVIDCAAPVQFVINAASGSSDAQATREVIESVLREEGRRGELHFCGPAELPRVARVAARRAVSHRTAVVAVGGDGTLNAVAQAAHAAGCVIGVVPRGTFNYFARTHALPADPAEAVRLLLRAAPVSVQVAGVNDRIFLVNASLGLYPELLEDREAFKSRFGRSRWVALWAAGATLMRAQRRWRLRIEQGGAARDVHTLTLFVGNNRLQLERVGLQPPWAPESGRISAVMLRPVGTLALLGLLLRGAMGTLGEAQSVEHFEFDRLVVRPWLPWGRQGVKVAFDGEVTRLRAPLEFRVLPQPLYLLRPPRGGAAQDAVSDAAPDAPGRSG
jgi:diacylglycerol kinase family enzyme